MNPDCPACGDEQSIVLVIAAEVQNTPELMPTGTWRAAEDDDSERVVHFVDEQKLMCLVCLTEFPTNAPLPASA